MSGDTLWSDCVLRLEALLPEAEVNAYLRPLHAVRSPDQLTLLAPNRVVVDRVRRDYLPAIRRTLSELLPYDLTLNVTVGAPSAVRAASPERVEEPAAAAVNGSFASGRLDPRYTLDAFIEGKSNSQARAAAEYVASAPGGQYNPLLIYGESGLGKTHLMHGVGHSILRSNPKARVVYVGAEQWLNQFTSSIRLGRAEEFKNHYRTADALLIDDIHFIAGKERTQEEFFHTFNALIDGRKQIVLTCDRYPKELDGLDERLKTRFAWGLSVPVDSPDLETRVAILLSKAEQQGLKLKEDVAFLIARRVRSNVRELEGALNRLAATARLSGSQVTPEFATESLRDMFAVYDRAVTLDNIKKEVVAYFNIRLNDLSSARRTRSLARPRQIAMALAKELTQHSYTEIGDAFGKDHTTVLHAHRKVAELRESDPRVREDYSNLLRKLTN
ncbi:chromosomal replication initiator protein DnaA [Brevundimonas sp.]|uniref:chromosomal replication initiator protein DnaA n=1 Tax=Brevundimonas sp. TaxID=1871086 RepID=UPI002737DDCA|nr:chromosomal replication initiator protein DnaA [Brevundimonas sp.]MDP3803216.1 chromosomal replication initiator protein DnaA [Brevundimonas sp.]